LGYPALSEITLSAWTFIGLFASVAAFRFAMRATKVDAEHLFAALSVYLLAGLYFGLLYWALLANCSAASCALVLLLGLPRRNRSQ